MNLKINGEAEHFDSSQLNITELLKVKNVDMPDMVSVQLNGEFITKDDYLSQEVKDGDEVDFLYFMGGGSR